MHNISKSGVGRRSQGSNNNTNKGEAMKTISARSAWSWLRENWLNPRRFRFWLAFIAILYTIVGFLVLPWVASSFAINTVADDLG
ncbi:MAG: hypothetical protein R6V21_08010, partial [Pelovirga sp.]